MKENSWSLAFLLSFLLLVSCSNRTTASQDGVVPPATLLPSTINTDRLTLSFLENRIKEDPDDFIAQNKLAAWHLQRLRETGDLGSLEIALKAARSSLATIPAERNTAGLNILAQAEFATHEFTAARQHAERLVELEPGKGYPFQILGDALLELGEYEKAESAFRSMEYFGSVQGITLVAMEQRMSRLA